jgi:cytidylate kinase
VGRGANFITARLPNVFHVRLVASLPKRIERVQRSNNLPPGDAAKLIQKEDLGRGRYAKAHFHGCVDDDLLYHLVINTGLIPCPDAAQLIAKGARRYFQSGPDGQK